MSKTNFTKVEKALSEGLNQITVNHLLELADSAASSMGGEDSKFHLPSQEQRTAALQQLDRELKKLHKEDLTAYKSVSYIKNDLKRLLSNPETLTPEDWKKIKIIKEKIELFRRELAKKLPHLSNEQIIEAEQGKHINKRFNVKDGWLPLK